MCDATHVTHGADFVSAAGLVVGLGGLLVPKTTRRHPLAASSRFLCLAVLLWHLACYTATAVAAVAAVPKLAVSIGLLTFTEGSQAVLQLVAQVAVAMALAALSRADLTSKDPDDLGGLAAPTAVAAAGPLPSLHESLANYWHHGRRGQQDDGVMGGASRSAVDDSAAGSSPVSTRESGLTPIRTRVGQAPPATQPPASLVSRLAFPPVVTVTTEHAAMYAVV